MKNNVKLFVLVAFIFLFSCGDKKVDTTAAREEMEAREIKVVPEAKVIERALQLGDSLVAKMNQDSAMTQSGDVYQSWNMSGTKISSTAYLMFKTYAMGEKETEVFQAYEYSAKNSIEVEPNIQTLPEAMVLYNAPIIENDKLVGMWSIHLPRKYIVLSIKD